MKNKALLIITGLLAFGILVPAIIIYQQWRAENPPGQKTYTVRGVILEIPAERNEARVRHEEIPGYMPAMTMSLPVKKPEVLNGIAPGDEVIFQLVVTEDDSWIARLEKTGQVFSFPGDAGLLLDAAVANGVDRVQPGEPVPNFALIDQDGRSFHLHDYEGKPVVMTFIYTRCPLPNFCPLMSKNFAALHASLQQELPGKYQLLSVTIDPEFDRPPVLKAYASGFTTNLAGWTFATGTAEEIDRVTGMFGLIRQPEGGTITHNLVTSLISPDGRLVQVWKRNEWTPAEIAQRVKELAQTGIGPKEAAEKVVPDDKHNGSPPPKTEG